MKRILSILGIITLIGTSTTSLIACNTKYTETELKELKEENKININGNTLEGIAPQEKPFNKVDNKGYFVIGRGDEDHDGKISKFKHTELKGKVIYTYSRHFTLELRRSTNYPFYFILFVRYIPFSDPTPGEDDDGTYFKAVYRGDGDGEPYKLVIDPKTGEVTDGKEVKEDKEDKEVKKDK